MKNIYLFKYSFENVHYENYVIAASKEAAKYIFHCKFPHVFIGGINIEELAKDVLI